MAIATLAMARMCMSESPVLITHARYRHSSMFNKCYTSDSSFVVRILGAAYAHVVVTFTCANGTYTVSLFRTVTSTDDCGALAMRPFAADSSSVGARVPDQSREVN